MGAKTNNLFLLLVLIIMMATRVIKASLVICGPSGVGKSTIIGAMCNRFPSKVALSVSHTSRKPRPGEQDGIDYFFVSKEEMEAGAASSDFLEVAHVHTNMYGTSKRAVESILAQKKVPILDVDKRGVEQIKLVAGFTAKYVFIAPPSIETLKTRLNLRGTETEADVAVRLGNAQREIEYVSK
jgi:guanylate kinase